MNAARERFAEIYQREYPAVLAFAVRRTQADQAEDVTHETFLTAWRRADAIPGDAAAVRPWLYTIARNHLMHHQRELSMRDALAIRIAETTQSTTEGPERIVTVGTDLAAAWHSLTAGQQEVLALAGWEELRTERHHLSCNAERRHARANPVVLGRQCPRYGDRSAPVRPGTYARALKRRAPQSGSFDRLNHRITQVRHDFSFEGQSNGPARSATGLQRRCRSVGDAAQ